MLLTTLTLLTLGLAVLFAPDVRTVECSTTTFTEFAYGDPLLPASDLPSIPWRVVASIPEGLVAERVGYRGFDIELVRSTETGREVWVTGGRKAGFFEDPPFLVYLEASQEWERINSHVRGTLFYVTQLVRDKSGTLWGQVEAGGVYGNRPTIEPTTDYTEPVLVRFDEHTRQFELDESTIYVTWDRGHHGLTGANTRAVRYDGFETFWIFAGNNALYSYDLQSRTLEKHRVLDRAVVDVAYSFDGSLFWRLEPSGDHRNQIRAGAVGNDELYMLDLTSGETRSLAIPSGWPHFFGMVVDRHGNLWLGATGYRDSEGMWHLVHSDPEFYFAHAFDYRYQPARLELIDSNGILWFSRFIDSYGSSREGTAWFDPTTNSGCVVTYVPAKVIEDDERGLWLIAGNKLFTRPLND